MQQVYCKHFAHQQPAVAVPSLTKTKTTSSSSNYRSSSSNHRCSSSLSGSSSNRLQNIQAAANTAYSTDSVTKTTYEEDEYGSTKQAEARKAWQDSVRAATGRKHHIIWEPDLDPPALLAAVCVVLVGPKKPISCGTVARACSCFECEDLRVVATRCSHNTRSSRSVSKGAQYILWRAQEHDELATALADVDLSVAFTRWVPDQQQQSLPDIPSLLQHPTVQQLLWQPQHPCSNSSSNNSSSSSNPMTEQHQWQLQHSASGDDCANGDSKTHGGSRPVRVALVFGREEYGLSDEEVAACDMACAISIGRLQESLSLSHAVSIVLAQFYQARLSCVAAAAAVPTTELPYSVQHVSQLAEGYDSNSGIEH